MREIIIYIGLMFFLAGVVFAEAVRVSWDPNKELDIMGYKIYYGLNSGSYDDVIDVDNVTSFSVKDLIPGQVYYFAVTAYDFSGNESGFSSEVSAIIDFDIKISQNFPNPFTFHTTLGFDASDAKYDVEITLKVYNIKGEYIKKLSFFLPHGHRMSRKISLGGMSTGMYFCKITANGRFVEVMKMLLIK